MGRIRSRLSGTTPARPACTTRPRPIALLGWPHAAAHDLAAWRPSSGRAPVQRARAVASLRGLHGGMGPRCSVGYACLNSARAWQRDGGHGGGFTQRPVHMRALGHGGAACGSGDKAAWSMASSARGGDATAVPTNGAEATEAHGGRRALARSVATWRLR
jgi:hypothetical protein